MCYIKLYNILNRRYHLCQSKKNIVHVTGILAGIFNYSHTSKNGIQFFKTYVYTKNESGKEEKTYLPKTSESIYKNAPTWSNYA